ncbi:Nre family DNA repair protein [Salinarchaeum sp. IM2453]|uniref:DNA repair protein NreA n=1 Tax=Salinarchaeum sp. IM2453 TaxID=2862870 RepID=UPI001C82F13D|nr:DNA repair protein NreA [Salinarchaeum sp. IM2453]QZA88955.1 Nre family DNA repair protein [Salinarchaeum sp. IM2453]
MRLGEFIEDFQEDESAKKRRLAKEKSYQITEYLEDVETRVTEHLQGDTLVGSTAPEIFVGRSGYPSVSTGVLSPVGDETNAAEYATSGKWYNKELGVSEVLQRRTGLVNSRREASVDVNDVWDGFVGAQREVAIADRPVDIEIGLENRPKIDFSMDEVTTPTGPDATAQSVNLTENPRVPRPVQKTLEDDDWRAGGAMRYLYRRGFDVYEINNILSAGALGRGDQRRLVPTRWSITAVDDQIGEFLRGQIYNTTAIDQVEVWYNEYMGNRFWIILGPGQWEFELVELKAPNSVWNPEGSQHLLMADSEGYEGRQSYVDETSGAYYAARLGVLEHLTDRDRQATCLVLREVTDEYWAPVGVWPIREAVRNAFAENQPAIAESFQSAVSTVLDQLPVSNQRLYRKSTLASGQQAQLSAFDS